jgi:hypothetical protein
MNDLVLVVDVKVVAKARSQTTVSVTITGATYTGWQRKAIKTIPWGWDSHVATMLRRRDECGP